MIQQLIDRGTLVKVQDEKGNSIEDWGIFGGWQNNIGDFVVGEGYKIDLNTDDIETFQVYKGASAGALLVIQDRSIFMRLKRSVPFFYLQ